MVYDEETDRNVRSGYAKFSSAVEITPRPSETRYRKRRTFFKAKPKYGSRASDVRRRKSRKMVIGLVLFVLAAIVIACTILIISGVI